VRRCLCGYAGTGAPLTWKRVRLLFQALEMAAEGGSTGFVVGQRVLDKKGDAATVKYVGPVATSKSAETVYVGLEWDDETRGKNDGSVTTADGAVVRYFTTSPGRGSFLKVALVDAGTSFVAALIDRYEGSTLDAVGGAGTVETASGRDLEVEFVGEDQIRGKQRLARNKNVALRGCRVATFDGDGKIAATCPNIEDLDLRDNLLYDWASLAPLGQQLPRLAVLNVSGNRFAPAAEGAIASLAGNFNALRVLVLSRTGTPWRDAVMVAQAMPTLEELHVCENGVVSLAPVGASSAAEESKGNDGGESVDSLAMVEGLSSLKVLNLSDNSVSSWREVWRLSQLPKLEQLLLEGNALTDVRYWPSDDAAGAVPFRALKFLSLASNAIASWDVVDRLRHFPSLDSLRFQRNPVTESAGPTEMRMVVIARLPALRTLNGSEVRPRERSDAEKTYLRRAGDAFALEHGLSSALDAFGAGASAIEAAASDATAGGAGGAGAGADVPRGTVPRDSELALKLLAEHPRYFDLLDEHGHVLVAAAADAGGATLAASVVKVTLRSMAAASCTVEPVERRLPLSMTIGSLKVMMQKIFKCELSAQRLSFKESGGAMFPTVLDDDSQTLSYYGVTDKGDILMEEIDPREAAREKAEQEAELAARMEKQLKQGEALRRHEQAAAAAQRAGASAAAAAAEPSDA